MARDDPTEPIFVDARPQPPPARRPPAPAATDRDRTSPGSAPASVPPRAAPRAPSGPHRRRRRPPPFMRPGAPGAIIMTGILAVIVAFVATFAYAIVDASKPIQEPVEDDQTEASYVPPTTVAGQTSTTRPPEDLTEEEVARRVAATVRPVQTRDIAGNPVTGSAFVVGSFGGQTLLLTSFEVVQASTRNPGPGISLDGRNASLWTWDESRDLALLVMGGSIESLPWATIAPKPGERVWAGGAGQKMSPGVVVGASDTGIEHNIFVDDVRRGAPLVNERGELLGMVSLAYNPAGRGTDTLFTAVPIRAACDRVLKCGSGNTAPEVEGTTASATTTTTRR